MDNTWKVIFSTAIVLVVSLSLVGLAEQARAWQLTVDLSDSDFGDDRVCASVEGGFGYGPYQLCTQAGRDAAVTFNVGDGIGEGESYHVCGWSGGNPLEYIFQPCERFTHGSGDEWVSVSA